MTTQAEVCISNCNKPLAPQDSKERTLFLQDNRHIKTAISKGTAFLLRNNYEDPAWKPALNNTTINRLRTIDPREQCTIADINASLGSEMLLALASFYQHEITPLLAQLNNYAQHESLGWSGAAATAVESRLSSFGKAVNRHHIALNTLHQGFAAKRPKIEIMRLENAVKSTIHDLNLNFKKELNKYFPHSAGKRGTVMTSAERAIGMARGVKTYEPLNISTGAQFDKVLSFAKASNYTGKGILVLDAGFRVEDVMKDKAAGRDWQRRAIMETTGFGLGSAAGAWVGSSIITSTIGIALMATPTGWIFVIGAGITAGYFAAKSGDSFGKWTAGGLYDTSKSISWTSF